MKRVLLIGSGPLPSTNPSRLGFPQLRVEHALRALVTAGHKVRLVLLGDERELAEARLPGGGRYEVVGVAPETPGWLDRVQQARLDHAPAAVISAGPYEPARAAALTVGDEPLFVDIPGDPFAEAQAKSAHLGEADATVHMRAAWTPALARADAFGVISHAQRHALLGQLGLMGRLVHAPLEHRWVSVMPAAYDFGGLAPGAPRVREPEDELVVAISGGYNTWLDADTLLEGLLLAMDELPGLRVISTGGGIPGHHTDTYEAFRAQANASRFAPRFTFHGWVPHEVLPGLLSRAHVGVCLDRPGVEAELGTRTRVLFYAHQGLEVLATPRSELTRELAGLRMLSAVPPGDADQVVGALEFLWREGCDGEGTARMQGYLAARYSRRAVMAPMVSWLEAPTRAEPAGDPSAELAAEVARLREALAAVHRSPTWRAAGAAERMLKRLPTRIDRLLGRGNGDGSEG